MINNIAELLANQGKVIMLFATPESIERTRKELRQNYDANRSRIERQYQLAKELLAEGEGVLKKIAPDYADLTSAREIIEDLRKKHGPLTVDKALAIFALLDSVPLQLAELRKFNAKQDEIDRIERRSEAHRFAEVPWTVLPGGTMK
jgi:hypothetical protein